MTAECDIGLIGLAVMGQNLILNMADHGFQVAAYNGGNTPYGSESPFRPSAPPCLIMSDIAARVCPITCLR